MQAKVPCHVGPICGGKDSLQRSEELCTCLAGAQLARLPRRLLAVLPLPLARQSAAAEGEASSAPGANQPPSYNLWGPSTPAQQAHMPLLHVVR